LPLTTVCTSLWLIASIFIRTSLAASPGSEQL
jgi:hypothetical protein